MAFGARSIDDALGLAKAGGFPIRETAEFHSALRRGCQVAPVPDRPLIRRAPNGINRRRIVAGT